jgi:hypothetical protein
LCAEKGRLFWESVPLPIEAMPTEAEAEAGKKALETLCQNKLEKYRSLVNKLLDAIESGNLYALRLLKFCSVMLFQNY